MNVNMEFVIDTLKVETVILVTNVTQNCKCENENSTDLFAVVVPEKSTDTVGPTSIAKVSSLFHCSVYV